MHTRHDILRAAKSQLGRDARRYNFNAYADARALFRYDMHTLPTGISASIGTSTLFAAWNAAIYVAQIEDQRLSEVLGGTRYLDATREVLQKHGASGSWTSPMSFPASATEPGVQARLSELLIGGSLEISPRELHRAGEVAASSRRIPVSTSRTSRVAAIAARWKRSRRARRGPRSGTACRPAVSSTRGVSFLPCEEAAAGYGVHRVLLIGGDEPSRKVPSATACRCCDQGMLKDCGVREIGVAGYPEGHPRISPPRSSRRSAPPRARPGPRHLRGHAVLLLAAPRGRLLRGPRPASEVSVYAGVAGPTDPAALRATRSAAASASRCAH